MRRNGPFGMGGVEAVEAEDGVEVDQAAALELGHLGVGQLDPHAVGLGELVEAAADADDGAAPQLGGVGVPHDRGRVVVAVGAQRLAEAGVVVFVPLPAGDPPPVRAVAGFAPGAAAGDLAARGDDAGVDRAEGGGGEGGEHARVDGDRLGDALAACQPGADELVGVGPVGFGARRADRGAAVPARDVDRLVRQVLGVQVAEDLAGGGVDVADGAAQPDRADAPTGRQGGGQPLLVVVAGRAVQQLGVEGAGARSWPVPVIDQDGAQGQCRAAHAQLPAGCWRAARRVEEEGEEGRPRARAAREAPRFPALLVSIRVLTHSVMTVA